jgi:2'-hydroxyisoflavone reductase
VRILILGGTKCLGRHFTILARQAGHEITHFNRGETNPGLFPDVERLQGNRDGGLDVLKGRTWDAAVDTCGYLPRVVGASARLLSGAVGHYTFVSSVSVYRDFSTIDMDETSPRNPCR